MAKLLKFEQLQDMVAWNDEHAAFVTEQLGLSQEQQDALFVAGGSLKIANDKYDSFKPAWLKHIADAVDDATNDDDETVEDASLTNGDATETETEEDEQDVTEFKLVESENKDAIALGEKLGSEFATDVREGYLARERVNITPLLTMNHMRIDLKDAMATQPKPNSYIKGGKVYVGTGDKRVEVKFSDNEKPVWDKRTTLEPNDDNKLVKRTYSHIRLMFLASTIGKELNTEFELLKEAVASFSKKANVAMPSKYRGRTRPQCIRLRNLADSRIRYGVNTTKAAINLDRQCRAIDELSLVGYRFEKEKVTENGKTTEEYVNRNEPVQVFAVTTKTVVDPKTKKETTTVSEGEPSNMSIGAFCRYDVAAAILKAGGKDKVTFAHLQETVTRDRDQQNKKETKKEDWSKTPIRTMNELENIFTSLIDYLTEEGEVEAGDSSEKRQNMIVDACAKQPDVCLAVGDVVMALDGVHKRIEKTYNTLSAQRSAAKLAEMQAKGKQHDAA